MVICFTLSFQGISNSLHNLPSESQWKSIKRTEGSVPSAHAGREARRSVSPVSGCFRIRAALCSETTSARLTRMHNDANVLAMGGGIISTYLAKDIVDTFLNTEFCGEEKHARRISHIE